MACIFCYNIENSNKLIETDNFFAVYDINPIQMGHMLIISKKHVMNICELNKKEINELHDIINKITNILEKKFDTGVSIVINNGAMMDEHTHFHVHMIPRYKDDKFWDNVSVKVRNISIENLKESIKISFK